MTDVHLGYEVDSGEPVAIPVMHTSLTGITRHGKSETMRALANRVADLDYTVLLFDVKAQRRDYEDVGTEIPIYLEEATDPTTVKGLLENQSGMSLSFQYSEIIKVYEPGDDYRSMLARIEDLMADDIHPVEEDKLRVLDHLLANLVDELDAVVLADDLVLETGINVMDLSRVSDAVQQLAIASTVERVLASREDVIIGVDEAHNFIPQKGQPPANQPLVKTIREGAASNVWLWLSDQTITGVDKDPLKQVGVWLLGKQRETNEAKRVLDQIPGRSAYTSEDVMTLSKGHFIVALDDRQPLAYVQPNWLDDDDARDIATGTRSMDDLSEPQTEDVQAIEEELAERESRIAELEAALDDREDRIADLNEQVEKLNALLEEQTTAGDAESEVAPAAADDEDRVREIARDELETFVEEVEAPGEVAVESTTSKLVVRRSVEPITVTTEDDTIGRICYLYAIGELPADKWLTTGRVEDALESHGWDDTVRQTDILNRLCRLGLMTMKYSGRRRDYRFKLSPEEAESKGLLELEEVPADA